MKAWSGRQPAHQHFSSKDTKGTLEDFMEVASSLCQVRLSFLPSSQHPVTFPRRVHGLPATESCQRLSDDA